jgi:hypothetical protein
MEKQCVMRGCTRLALYGFGSLRHDTIKFACLDHRGLIWPDEARSETPLTTIAPPPPRQGSLL